MKSSWSQRIIGGLAVLSVLALGWLTARQMVAAIDYRNSDFFTFYLAGWMNWHDLDPYSIKQWIAGHQQFGASWVPNPIFPYPLPLATLLAPLGLLDLYDGFVAWVFISGVLVMLTAAGLFARENRSHSIAYLLPLLAGAFLFRPTLVTFHDGQLGALWLFLIGCTIVLWSRGAWFAGGLILGTLALKPSLGFPLLALVGLWLIFQQRAAALAGLVTSGIGLALIGFIRDSNWPSDFLRISNQKLSGNFGASASVWGVSGAVCQYQERCTFLLGGLLAAALFAMVIYYLWTTRRALEPLATLGIASAAAVLVTPYLWAYDQILALIAVIATVIFARRINLPYLVTASYPVLLAALSLALVMVALQVGRDHWSALIPLLAMMILMAVLGRRGIGSTLGNRGQAYHD